MAIKNRLKTDPIPTVRQSRSINLRTVTTGRPGKLIPVAAYNLLRGDSSVGRVNVAVDMAETYEVLLNKMQARISSWFIPYTADERFERSMAIYERSFAGEKKTDDDDAEVIPYIMQKAFPNTPGEHQIYKALGLSAKAGVMINPLYERAYNIVENYRRRQRSKDLDLRLLDNSALAPAHWGPSTFSNIVPDFDDGLIAGELPLTVVAADIPIKGIGFNPSSAVTNNASVRDTKSGQTTITYPKAVDVSVNNSYMELNAAANAPKVFAELSEDSISVSLANMDQARKLVDWAKKREGYEGHPDEYVIDSMMQGLPIADLEWFEPMLIDSKLVKINQLRRMATDAANLEDGVANGVAASSLGVNVPPNMIGGVVMIFVEFMPEQLYERQADPIFTATGVNDLPHYKNDALNPMPVVEVKNYEIDVDHDNPAELFGYAERNWKWRNWPTRVGGDLYAPDADAATSVARRVIYPTDEENPSLTEAFYLTTNLPPGPFVATDKDPFLIGVGGTVGITGLTLIGEVHESEANYDALRADTPPIVPIK